MIPIKYTPCTTKSTTTEASIFCRTATSLVILGKKLPRTLAVKFCQRKSLCVVIQLQPDIYDDLLPYPRHQIHMPISKECFQDVQGYYPYRKAGLALKLLFIRTSSTMFFISQGGMIRKTDERDHAGKSSRKPDLVRVAVA